MTTCSKLWSSCSGHKENPHDTENVLESSKTVII